MVNAPKFKFLDSFPDHVYRYIDQTGAGRSPVSSQEPRDDLNKQGYEAYFTVNGFRGATDAKKENCSSINAFFVDIDGRKDQKELEEIMQKLMPTFILETKNGHHIYWLLDESVYKEDITTAEWDQAVLRWERIEQSIVTALKADPVVKDITRIMRMPNTLYWKKSGDAWKGGVKNAPFKIKGVHKAMGARYTMEQVEEVFPQGESSVAPFSKTPEGERMQKYAEAERKSFFEMVNTEYPIEERPSFHKLISGEAGTLPPSIPSRNQALLIVGTLMRQAGWQKQRALEQLQKVGWHGIEAERGGWTEIQNTLESAYRGNYTYSYKHDVIAFNMTAEEQQKIQATYTKVSKLRKDTDKVRFSNYEYEIVSRYPYLKKNEVGLIFNYDGGVYKLLSDQELSNIILSMLYDDMLWGYRTKKYVQDKIACLLSIIPDLVLTNDKGELFNVRNGLIHLPSGELKPHTPDFVSLIQSQVIYDPEAVAPTWEKCLEAWMEGPEQKEKTEILQQFCGYLLTSSMTYAKALFMVGDGGNGKSTFADTIAMVIGEAGTSNIDLEDLYSTFGLKGLIGKRLNIVEEVGGNYYQAHKLKKLISGEPITINMKFKDQFKFSPQAKFIFAVNQMPRVDDASTATERRTIVVMFNNNFRNRPNTDLRFADGLLAQELPGILNWMMQGYRMLMASRQFTVTEEQKHALLEYREENSSVEGFIGECLEFGEGYQSTAREMYGEYKDWCMKDGRKFKSAIAFTKELKAYGKRLAKFHYEERQSGRGVGTFEGVQVRSQWKDDNFDDTSPRYNANRGGYTDAYNDL